MTLIKCEDCGKEISDKASSCIHCGCPIENTMDVIEEDDESGNEENMLDEEYEEDEEYESDEEYEEEYEEEYDKNCASWYDLSDDRQNELKEEFYEKIGRKPENAFLMFLAGFIIGFFAGLFLFFAFNMEGEEFFSGNIVFAICIGFFFVSWSIHDNKKLDEQFISWLKHSKGIHKGKE